MTNVRSLGGPLLCVAAVASTLACLAAVFAGSILAAGFAAAAGILVLGALSAEYLRGSSDQEALISKAARQAEAGRKLAIYERETGLLAHWYLRLRGEEECDRAARYKRPLTLLVVEPAPGSDTWEVQGNLADWLLRHLRAVDISGYLGNGRYVVLMPETEIAGAQDTVARLQDRIDNAQTGLSGFPEDGVMFEQLYAVASERLCKAAERAA